MPRGIGAVIVVPGMDSTEVPFPLPDASSREARDCGVGGWSSAGFPW